MVSFIGSAALEDAAAKAYMPTAVPYLFWKITEINRAFQKFG